MGSDHRFVTLGECLTLIIDHRGKTPRKLGSDWVEHGIRAISAKNVNGGRLVADGSIRYVTSDVYRRWMNSGDVKRGDCLLVSEGATLGECMYWDEESPIVLGQRLFCLRPNPGHLNPRYLYAYMTSHSFQSEVIARATGTSVPGLRQTEVLKLHILLPLLAVQERIGDFLYHVNKKIELNRRMNETLESMARALFKSWFVDFGPVRAKADGRDPCLPKHIADTFPDSFEKSELGEIPKGWKLLSIGDLADVVGGGTPSTKESKYWADGIHAWATPKDLSGLTVPLLLGTERQISNEGLGQISSGLLPKGTLLLSSRAPIGYLAIAELPVAINQGFIAMIPKPGISNVFLLLWARTAHEEIKSRANGSTFLEISKANFRPIPVVMPAPEVMSLFERQTRPIYSRIVENTVVSRTLGTIRDTLLPKLVSGELRVMDAERVASEAGA